MRPALYASLAAWMLAASGCSYFTSGLRAAGLRREAPTGAGGHGPLIAAWADPERGRLSVKYQILVNGLPAERWLNLTRRQVSRSLDRWAAGGREGEHNLVVLPDGFAARLVSRRPRWRLSGMRMLEPYLLKGAAGVKDGRFVGVSLPEGPPGPRAADGGEARAALARVWLVMDLPETAGKDVVVFYFPQRQYRTFGGHLAQVFLPVTVVLDAAASVLEVVGLICTVTNWTTVVD